MFLLIFPIICGILCLKLLNKVQELYAAVPKGCVWRKICLAADVVLAVPILVYPMTLIADIMMFDAPGSESNPRLWMWFILLAFYPLALLLLMVLITLLCKKRAGSDDC